MVALAAGQRPTAALLNDLLGVSTWDTQVTAGTTTSTTYTATLTGGTACGVTFVAPASGKVVIKNMTQLQASANNGFCTVVVRTGAVIGSGTVFFAASDDEAVIVGTGSTPLFRGMVETPISGLTPGNTYNVQQAFKLDGAGTLTTTRKRLRVKSIL